MQPISSALYLHIPAAETLRQWRETCAQHLDIRCAGHSTAYAYLEYVCMYVCMYICMYLSRLGIQLFRARATRKRSITCARVTLRNVTAVPAIEVRGEKSSAYNYSSGRRRRCAHTTQWRPAWVRAYSCSVQPISCKDAATVARDVCAAPRHSLREALYCVCVSLVIIILVDQVCFPACVKGVRLWVSSSHLLISSGLCQQYFMEVIQLYYSSLTWPSLYRKSNIGLLQRWPLYRGGLLTEWPLNINCRFKLYSYSVFFGNVMHISHFQRPVV